jgi:hypothetical protein
LRTQITTPRGTAQYPKLRTPEYFEGAEVGYTIQMLFNKEDTDKLIARLEAELEAAKNSSEFKGKKWTNARIGTREDKNGDIVFKFKTKTSYQLKTGEIKQRTIPIFDAQGTPIKGDIGHGSICRVRFTVNPYHKSSANCGLTLYLDAVQVIEYKEPGGVSAEAYGFEKEDGYTVESNETVSNTAFDTEEF